MAQKTPPFDHYPEWTQARFWGFLRSALRRASDRFPPKQQAKLLYRRPFIGEGRQKWEYQCVECREWFPEKAIQIDHILPVGQLRDWDNLPIFCKKLFCGVEGYQVMCKPCHQIKTNKERYDR